MGVFYQMIKGLESPLSSLKHLSNLIPESGELAIANSTFKIVIGLHSRVSMEVAPGVIFPLEDRDVIVLPKPCAQIYRRLGTEGPSTFQTLLIMFDRKQVFKSPDGWGGSLSAEATRLCIESFSEPVRIPAGTIDDLDSLLSALRKEMERRQPGRVTRVNSLICALLIDLARAAEPSPAAPAEPVRGNRKLLVHLADEFMYRNLSRPLTVGEIAWHLKLSQEHLSRVFRQETGHTLKHYLGMMRVNHARNLLLESNLPIAQISEACGFSTRALFYRTFRQFLKMSPGEYRKGNQGETTHYWITPTSEAPSNATGA